MWLEPPPKPPQETEQTLTRLASYYRQLIAYHQQSAALASAKLAQVEALLTTSSSYLTPSWQYPLPQSFGNTPELIAELEESVQTSLPEVKLPAKETLTKTLQQILKRNKGKMLRLDYLALDVAEKLSIPPSAQPQLKPKLRELLHQGEGFNLWYGVPDSPDCWTISLTDFPDLNPESAPKPKKRKKPPTYTKKPYNLSRLPDCPKLDQYGTLTATIRACLKENYPTDLDANEVMDWMFPRRLTGKDKAKAYQAISDGLNKGCSRNHWTRVEVGRYVWNKELDYESS
ncbi:MAG TPA: hypothetical protein ACFCUY_02725 [Xenococcaceae cyanobacterium]|jgi:hypothetical protein